ncbi:hypothetical protein [Chryseobacterium sp.]|uniref:hypothetical protein n=1 Tax=Chryseobacterium sp. TaxID=1871047 RepID=UPI00289B6B01|nr:hypothetical protein [Chryseobacterium sp.]
MIYYGVVDKIKPQHRSGVYGRRKLSNNEKKEISQLYKETSIAGYSWEDFIPIYGWYTMIKRFTKLYKWYNLKRKEEDKITIQEEFDTSHPIRTIIIPHNSLNDYYNIEKEKDIFYGLFDDFTFPSHAFEKLMQSKGGSDIIIIERNSIPKNIKHFGGLNGNFHTGLYCAHPKDENQLIPLENSNELLKNMILEETLSAYQNLGAKRVIIEDKTIINFKGGFSKLKNKIDSNLEYKKEILREKQYGKGTFNPEKALENKLFIHDYPNIKTTIEGRISGNQTLEKFTETVNLNAGLDVNVLSLYKGNLNFEYNRKWYFEVEFYDKNDI